jgi:hypothetical protein
MFSMSEMSDMRMMGELTITGQKELDCQHNQTRLACIPSHPSSAQLLTLLMVSNVISAFGTSFAVERIGQLLLRTILVIDIKYLNNKEGN